MARHYRLSSKARRVFVAGHRGMVGSALVRRLARGGCALLTAGRAELDLRDRRRSIDWFARHKPHAVFLAAAKVGGIVANDTLPAEFLYDNLAIAANVIHAAHRQRRREADVPRLVLHLSQARAAADARGLRCSPARWSRPTNGMRSPRSPASRWCQAYRSQYGCDFISAMPTNLYGPGDNYHPEYSHVVAALIRRFHEAKLSGAADVVVWGTGTPRREFLYVDDLADACVHLMKNYSSDRARQYRHRRRHHHRRIRPRGRRGRRLWRRDQSSIPRGPTARRANGSMSAAWPHWAGARAPRSRMESSSLIRRI